MNLKSFVGDLLKSTKQTITAGGLDGRKEITGLALGAEGLDEATRSHAQVASDSLSEAIDRSITMLSAGNEDFKLSGTQRQAAMMIAKLAVDPKSYMSAPLREVTAPAGSTQVSAESLGYGDVVQSDMLSTEAFDGQAVNNALYYSIVFNAGAARQDTFGEAFFPTIVIDPTVSGISVDVEFTSIYTDFERSASGASNAAKFQRTPVVKAIYDNTLFGTDKNRLIPVKTTDSSAFFVANQDTSVTANGETFTTAPLAIGKTVNLLGISQTPAMLAKGVMDSTDAIDHSINLDKVYFTLTEGSGQSLVTETFRMTVSAFPGANFVGQLQGNFKTMTLSFDSDSIIVNTDTTTMANGAASTILGGLANNHTVRLKMKLHGDANVQVGDISVYGSAFEIVEIKNAAGDVLPSTNADYIAIAAVFNTGSFLGYTLDAWRTNSNLRTRGLLVTNDKYVQVYNVNYRSGITVLSPVNNAGGVDNDASKLTSQIQTAGIRANVSAVQTLTNYAGTLSQVISSGAAADVKLVGAGGYLVNPYYHEFSVDLGTSVDSIKSNERYNDVRAALVNRIREEVLNMYVSSNYNVAYEVMRGNLGGKIGVVVGTDPHLKQYLTSDSSRLNIGEEFEVTVVSTPNKLVSGKIFITFVVDDAEKNSVINPLNFGNFLWAPTITTDVVRSNGGAVIREFHNIPRYMHIINLPILAQITVANLNLALGKLAINMHTV
jgi:hypothetical protein